MENLLGGPEVPLPDATTCRLYVTKQDHAHSGLDHKTTPTQIREQRGHAHPGLPTRPRPLRTGTQDLTHSGLGTLGSRRIKTQFQNKQPLGFMTSGSG